MNDSHLKRHEFTTVNISLSSILACMNSLGILKGIIWMNQSKLKSNEPSSLFTKNSRVLFFFFQLELIFLDSIQHILHTQIDLDSRKKEDMFTEKSNEDLLTEKMTLRLFLDESESILREIQLNELGMEQRRTLPLSSFLTSRNHSYNHSPVILAITILMQAVT